MLVYHGCACTNHGCACTVCNLHNTVDIYPSVNHSIILNWVMYEYSTSISRILITIYISNECKSRIFVNVPGPRSQLLA